MSSLPTVWIAVGVLLLLLTVVMAILFFLKSREVATLKKQCEDLRDTMRMMRYEEASLSRMLHTANKPMPQESVDLVTEEPEEDAIQLETLVVAETVVESVAEGPVVAETVENLVEEVAEEFEPEMQSAEPEEEEAPTIVSEQELVETLDNSPMFEESEDLDSTANDVLEETTAVEDIQPTMAQPHKQPINERRPAIPNDLFSAWFAANEEASEEEEAAASLEIVEESVVESEKVEKPVVEALVSQEAISKLAVEESLEFKPAQEMELSKDDERFFRKLERIVNTRLRNPNLNIDIIAAQFGIGRTNFYRKVREVTGMSPNDYLRKCRMERAAELLNNSEVAVSEVCVQVGIPDAQYFSRVFKTFYGVSPSVYRENNNQ